MVSPVFQTENRKDLPSGASGGTSAKRVASHRFDLDHRGAEVRENAAGHRRRFAREIDDDEPLEERFGFAGHGRTLRVRGCCAHAARARPPTARCLPPRLLLATSVARRLRAAWCRREPLVALTRVTPGG